MVVESADSGIESADSIADFAINPLRIGLWVWGLRVHLRPAHTFLLLRFLGCVHLDCVDSLSYLSLLHISRREYREIQGRTVLEEVYPVGVLNKIPDTNVLLAKDFPQNGCFQYPKKHTFAFHTGVGPPPWGKCAHRMQSVLFILSLFHVRLFNPFIFWVFQVFPSLKILIVIS